MGLAVISSQLPVSVYKRITDIEIPFTGSVGPAPLDNDSLFNGVLKFEHQQIYLADEEIEWVCNRILQDMRPVIYKQRYYTVEEAAEMLEPKTASGIPYSSFSGSRKGDTLKVLTPLELWNDFLTYDQVHTVTLKDEMREPGKDARLFRPSNIASVLAGIVLFGHQNEQFCAARHHSPYKVGISAPGPEMVKLWSDHRSFSSKHIPCDGEHWDTKFPVWGVAVVKRVRKALMDEFSGIYPGVNMHSLVDRYYDQMYLGWSRVDGLLMRLIGNPSGQFNTSSDNTLLNMAVNYLLQRRLKVAEHDVLFSVYGDDLLISTQDSHLTPLRLREEAAKLGVYFATFGDNFSKYGECSFIGTFPVGEKGLYTYSSSKLLGSLHFRKKGATDYDYVRKMVSICFLLRFSPVYDQVYQFVKTVIHEKYPSYIIELKYCGPEFAEKCYLGWEGATVPCGLLERVVCF